MSDLLVSFSYHGRNSNGQDYCVLSVIHWPDGLIGYCRNPFSQNSEQNRVAWGFDGEASVIMRVARQQVGRPANAKIEKHRREDGCKELSYGCRTHCEGYGPKQNTANRM